MYSEFNSESESTTQQLKSERDVIRSLCHSPNFNDHIMTKRAYPCVKLHKSVLKILLNMTIDLHVTQDFDILRNAPK